MSNENAVKTKGSPKKELLQIRLQTATKEKIMGPIWHRRWTKQCIIIMERGL